MTPRVCLRVWTVLWLLVSGVFTHGTVSAQPADQNAPAAAKPPQGANPGLQNNVVAAPPAEGSRFDLWVGHAVSDNLARLATKARGSYNSLGALFDMNRAMSRIDLALNGTLERRFYSTSLFDNEAVGSLEGLARFTVARDRFWWSFQDDFGQGRVDTLRASSPENRQPVNVISTGPELDLPLGRRTKLAIGSRYSVRSYGTSKELEGDATTSEIGLIRQVREGTTVSLVAQQSETNYDGGQPSYHIDTARLRYRKTLTSGAILAEGGKNEIVYSDFMSDGPLWQLVWTRNLSSRSRLDLSTSREFTDSGGLFGLTTGQIAVTRPTEIILAPNPLEQRRAGIAYTLTLSRTVATLLVRSFHEEYVKDSTLDNNGAAAVFQFRYKLNSRMSLAMDYTGEQRDFVTRDASEYNRYLSISLEQRLPGHMGLEYHATRNHRTGFDPYEETVYEIRLVFSPERVRARVKAPQKP